MLIPPLTGLTKHEKYALMQLVTDAQTYGLDDQESLAYIEPRLGKPITRTTLWKYKRHIQSSDQALSWLKGFSRVGFVAAIKQRIEEMRLLQQDSWREYLYETSKPYDAQNWKRINALRERLEAQNKRLTELELATPIIAEIKQIIDRHDGQPPVFIKGKSAETDDPALGQFPV